MLYYDVSSPQTGNRQCNFKLKKPQQKFLWKPTGRFFNFWRGEKDQEARQSEGKQGGKLPYHMPKLTVKLFYMRQCDTDKRDTDQWSRRGQKKKGCVFANSIPDTDSIENRCKKDGLLTKVVLGI